MKRILGMKPTTIVEVISALFILLFFYTALEKSFNIQSTTNVLKRTPLLSDFAPIVAWGVVIIEYIIAAILFFPKTRKLGLVASLTLMSCFTIYIGYMMAFVPELPCTCGGVISEMTWGQHLIFNFVFITLAYIGIRLDRTIHRPKRFDLADNAQIVYT